jgi:hypothetical protein
MANVLGPFGFRYLGLVDGSPPNFGIVKGKAAYNVGTLFGGDPLVLSSGKLVQASTTGNTGAAIAGIAVSFGWISAAFGYHRWTQYYPNSDSVNNADIDVYYVNNPNALFLAQVCSSSAGTAVGGPAAQADVGSFFNFSTGAGGNTAGISSFGIDYSTKNASAGSLPFYLYALDQAPGTDPTTAGNLCRFGIANLSKGGGD